jgi:hypothetical protein
MHPNIALILKLTSFALKSCGGGSGGGRSTPIVNAGNTSDGAGRSTLAFVLTFVCPCKSLVNKMEGTRDDNTDSMTAGGCPPDKVDSRTIAVGILLDVV